MLLRNVVRWILELQSCERVGWDLHTVYQLLSGLALNLL